MPLLQSHRLSHELKVPTSPSQGHVVDFPMSRRALGVVNGASLVQREERIQLVPILRKLGDTEVSYYLPSRESGVNDMYLHLGLDAEPHVMSPQRIRIAWAILRSRQPLLAATVQMNSYEEIYFHYSPVTSSEAALAEADNAIEYRNENAQVLIDNYLNGPRTLSDKRLSYLIVSSTDSAQQQGCKSGDDVARYDILICATHFLGDGMALHQSAQELLTLLATETDESLLKLLQVEAQAIREKAYNPENASLILPLSLEERLPQSPRGALFSAASLVDHLASQRRQIGGHSFPKKKAPTRRTIVRTLSYDAEKTKAILRRCKENGVSISSAVFALCNIAWAQTQTKEWEHPMMMYSALNLRSYLEANERLNKSYFFLCIGFFNITLPSYIPRESDRTQIFWHRARAVKEQTAKIARSPLLVSRVQEMAKERENRARMWARLDDGVAPTTAPSQRRLFTDEENSAPSVALMGLSMLGNLDGIYRHSTFPAIKLHSMTTGSRQRKGGMLLFSYTFVGKLWLGLGYDVNGFDDAVVQRFWRNFLNCVDVFLL